MKKTICALAFAAAAALGLYANNSEAEEPYDVKNSKCTNNTEWIGADTDWGSIAGKFNDDDSNAIYFNFDDMETRFYDYGCDGSVDEIYHAQKKGKIVKKGRCFRNADEKQENCSETELWMAGQSYLQFKTKLEEYQKVLNSLEQMPLESYLWNVPSLEDLEETLVIYNQYSSGDKNLEIHSKTEFGKVLFLHDSSSDILEINFPEEITNGFYQDNYLKIEDYDGDGEADIVTNDLRGECYAESESSFNVKCSEELLKQINRILAKAKKEINYKKHKFLLQSYTKENFMEGLEDFWY